MIIHTAPTKILLLLLRKQNRANFCKTGYGSSSMEDLSNGAIPRFWNRFWVEIRRWGQTGADNQSITL